MRLAQHLWMNGKAAKEIAAKVKARQDSIQGYLASLGLQHAVIRRAETLASLKATVLASLTDKRDYLAEVHLCQHHAQMTLRTTLLQGGKRVAHYWRAGNRASIQQAPVKLVRPLQSIDHAVRDWYETMRSKWRGVNVEIRLQFAADEETPVVQRARRIDLRALKRPMIALLDHCWKEPRKQYDGYNQCVAVSLEHEPIATYLRDRQSEPMRINSRAAREVVETASTIYRECELALEGTSFSVYVTGETLEFPEAFANGSAEAAETDG
jgi:hypothetical protein